MVSRTRSLRSVGALFQFRFPGLVVLHAVLNEWAASDERQDEAIEEVHGKAQGADHVHEKPRPHARCVVRDFVFVGVVKHQALPFLPMPHVLTDPDATLLTRLWYQKPEVVPEDAIERAPMRGDVFPRRQDGEERGLHSGNGLHQARRLRAAVAVLLHLDPIAVEEIRLPAIIVRDRSLVTRNVLEIRKSIPVLQYTVQLTPDARPVCFQRSNPAELVRLEEGGIPDKRPP